MALTFELKMEKVEQPWKTITSIDNRQLKHWGKQRELLQQYYMRSYMKERFIGSNFDKYYNDDNKSVINTVSKYCEHTVANMFRSILFLFTTPEGIVLSVHGPEELTKSLDQKHNAGIGSVFTIENAGLNAISISIKLKDWVFLSGSDHDLKLFREWSCFCSPVRYNGKIMGYLDMSFSVKDDHLLMAAIFASTLKSIEEELGKFDQKKVVYKQFQCYHLSPREREVGYMWINNCSALRIASELGITEGTVRNVIKKIYRKTGVCDKGQFIRKFIVS